MIIYGCARQGGLPDARAIQGQFLKGVGALFFLSFFDRLFDFSWIGPVGEQSPCFFTVLPCVTQTDFGVGANGKEFFLVGKPILEPPRVYPRRL